jgi:type II secretory pathway pseudopilin PulG
MMRRSAIDAQKKNATRRLAADGTSAGRNAPVAVPATAKRCRISFLRGHKRSARSCRHRGFTLTEIMLVGGLMSLLVLLISGAWKGLGRSSTDAVVRCRVAQEANLALESLTRDLGGGLAGQIAGDKRLGRAVGRLVVGGSQLWLCFDGEPVDGVADWGPPDTVIIYEVQGNRLVRCDQQTEVATVVADKVNQMQLTEQMGGVRIELTLQYRDLTRTYTIVARDP